jgi:predicted 3-demethylubiquinone-9 3-methyltransferase (glyoxalase superfamily)
METQVKEKPIEKIKEMGMKRLTPFLWFHKEAEEAVNFYTSLFGNSKIKRIARYSDEGAQATGMPKGSVMTVDFQLQGQDFAALNGGPAFTISPSISFFVNCDNLDEINRLWAKLSEGGTIFMEFDTYPFSEKYGWVQDKFGVSWQLILPGREQKIAPCLMFSGEQHLKAEEAINFYTSVFNNSGIIQLERYVAGQGPEGAVVHAKFTLDGQEFIAMDSHINLQNNFNPAVSFVVNCGSQKEIDYYWNKLSEGGPEQAQQCGWLQDRYGVSWQVVPTALIEMLNHPNKAKAGRVMQAMLQMKKLDIDALTKAFERK